MVSVIIPYVRDRGYLREAIASVEAQTYTDWQLVEICGNRTQGANINHGLRYANGEFIKILHDDDILPSNSLIDLYDGIQGYDFVCGDMELFGEKLYCPNPGRGFPITMNPPTLERMLKKNCIAGGTTLYRKDMLLAVGGYNEQLHTGEEYDLHLKLLKNGYRCNYIMKIVHHYRLHEFNKSYYMRPEEKIERRKYIKEIANRYKHDKI